MRLAAIRAAEEQHESEHDPAQAPGRDVDHHEEQAEVEQRRAEVALQHDDRHGEHPDDQDRSEVAGPRERHAEEAAPDERQRIARLHEVAREEDRQSDLGELAGLERQRADLDPDVCAETRAPDAGDDREDQQQERGEHRHVAEPLQHPVVADREDHGEGDHDGDRGPGDLPDAGGVPAVEPVGDVEAGDLRDADAVEQRGDREEERVGIGGDDAERDVHPDDECGEQGAEQQDRRADAAEGAELHQRDRDPADPDREQQQHELDVASAGRRAQAHPDRPREGRARLCVDGRHRHSPASSSSRLTMSMASRRSSALIVASTLSCWNDGSELTSIVVVW